MTRLSSSTVRFRSTPHAEKQISWCSESSRAIMNLCTGKAEGERDGNAQGAGCPSSRMAKGKWACKAGNPARGLNPSFLRLYPMPSGFATIPQVPCAQILPYGPGQQLPQGGSRGSAHRDEGTTDFQPFRRHSSLTPGCSQGHF